MVMMYLSHKQLFICYIYLFIYINYACWSDQTAIYPKQNILIKVVKMPSFDTGID